MTHKNWEKKKYRADKAFDSYVSLLEKYMTRWRENQGYNIDGILSTTYKEDRLNLHKKNRLVLNAYRRMERASNAFQEASKKGKHGNN
jgi:hypothetical protein